MNNSDASVNLGYIADNDPGFRVFEYPIREDNACIVCERNDLVARDVEVVKYERIKAPDSLDKVLFGSSNIPARLLVNLLIEPAIQDSIDMSYVYEYSGTADVLQREKIWNYQISIGFYDPNTNSITGANTYRTKRWRDIGAPFFDNLFFEPKTVVPRTQVPRDYEWGSIIYAPK